MSARLGLRVLAVCVLGGMASEAFADSTNPAQSDICVNGIVDREKLAAFVLDAQHVSRKLDAWATDHGDARFGPGALQRVVGDETICSTSHACVGDDQLHLLSARGTVKDLLKDAAYDNQSGVTNVTTFFSDPHIRIGCRTADGSPIEMTGVGEDDAKDPKLPLRIRGAADDLVFRQGSDGFKSASKATLSYSDDSVADKRSTKIVAAVGAAFRVADNPAGALLKGHPTGHNTLWVIPYGGIDRESSQTGDKAASASADNWRLGVILSLNASRVFGNSARTPINNIIDVRPEYVFDRKEDSQVGSINVRYRPVLTNLPSLPFGLNAFSPINGISRSLRVMPILDFRWNSGHFFRQGSRADDLSHDFSRIGFEGGLGLNYADGHVPPIDLRVTEDYLYGLAGYPRSLSQLKSSLGFSLDPEQMFGVNIAYIRGKSADLADRSQQWSVGLTIRY